MRIKIAKSNYRLGAVPANLLVGGLWGNVFLLGYEVHRLEGLFQLFVRECLL